MRAPLLPLALACGLLPLGLQLAAPVPRLDSDAVEYYSHLRSLYFDHDLDFGNEFEHFGISHRWDKAVPTRTGLRRTNFSVGPALLWMPFYAAGDLVARGLDEVEDGYSPWHVRAVCLGSLAYGLAGLFLVHDVLRRRFTAGVAFWTCFLLLYATFLYWYLVYDPVMSHAGTFFCAALLLRLFWGERDGLSARGALLQGRVVGLAATVRWQSAVLLLLPALALLRQARSRPGDAAKKAFLGLLAFGLGALPQMLAFKAIFGSYILTELPQGRDYLHWRHPFLLETLFSSRHGLLYWTPVLWLAGPGLLALWRRERRGLWPILATLAVMTYVNASAGDWWAGGSFSSRRFDSALPFLALGLAAALSGLQEAVARRPEAALVAGAGLLTAWNVLFMEQYRANRMPRDETVSFARVAETNADILADLTGSPLAWPANWIFAVRHGLPPAKFDLMVGKYLFLRQNRLDGLIDLGDDRADPALLGEGWSPRRPCEGAVCRAVLGRARLFAPLDKPETLDVTVRVAGRGVLRVTVNGKPAAALPLASRLADLRFRVPRARWRHDLNEVALEVGRGEEAVVDLLLFVRAEARP